MKERKRKEGRKDRKKRRINEGKNETKKEKDCFFRFRYFNFISLDLGFQLSTVSSSMNGLGGRLANNVWDEMVFENHCFTGQNYPQLMEYFASWSRIFLNIAMTQGTRLVHMLFVGLQRPSHRALRDPLSANCVALDQVVLFSSFPP